MAAEDVEFGHVVDLTLGEPSGTELVADAAIGATTLSVEYAGDFEDSGDLNLNGATLAYTSITYGAAETDPDVINLAAPLAAAAATDDKVGRMAGGELVTEWLLHVSQGDGHPAEIPIPYEQRAIWSSVDVSTPIPVFVSADLERLVEVPGRIPRIDGSLLDPSTLPDVVGNALIGNTITGANIRTAASGQRTEISDAGTLTGLDDVRWYTGGGQEISPAFIGAKTAAFNLNTVWSGPQTTTVATPAVVQLISYNSGLTQVSLIADQTVLGGDVQWGGGPGWTTYTPTFIASTTNPTLGNFTRAGRYARWGKTIFFSIVITCNASTGLGSGTYGFGLPVAARADEEIVVQASQTAPLKLYLGKRYNPGDATQIALNLTSDFSAATNTTTAMASGTVLRITGTYEAA